MIRELWKARTRPVPLGSEWWRTWAKRIVQSPVLLKQWRIHFLLRRRGAKVSSTAFFSDSRMIGGTLSEFSVGDGSFIGRVEVSLHAPVTIGRNVCINDGAKLLSASHDVADPQWRMQSAPICIGDLSWIATNAIILPGVTIGRGAVVGAGAVVSRDVPDLTIVAGNPAQALSRSRPGNLDYSPSFHLALFEAWLGKEPRSAIRSE